MNSKELQKSYSNLKDELSELRLSKAKAEATLESLNDRQKEIKEEIKKLAGTDNLEEAKKKLEALETKLSDLIEKAEGILNE